MLCRSAGSSGLDASALALVKIWVSLTPTPASLSSTTCSTVERYCDRVLAFELSELALHALAARYWSHTRVTFAACTPLKLALLRYRNIGPEEVVCSLSTTCRLANPSLLALTTFSDTPASASR